MIKVVIFDFDGVIVDDEPIHFRAFQQVLKEQGINFTEEEYWQKYLAMTDKDLFHKLLKEKNINLSPPIINNMIKKKVEYFFKYFQDELIFFHGIKNVLINLSKHFILAIASGALLKEIKFALEKLDVSSLFKIMVTAEEVSEGKPHPEIFYLAYKKLIPFLPELKTSECLVIEDSINGIKAAHNANMKCIAVAHSYKEEDLKEADAIIDHISQLNSNLIKEMFE